MTLKMIAGGSNISLIGIFYLDRFLRYLKYTTMTNILLAIAPKRKAVVNESLVIILQECVGQCKEISMQMLLRRENRQFFLERDFEKTQVR